MHPTDSDNDGGGGGDSNNGNFWRIVAVFAILLSVWYIVFSTTTIAADATPPPLNRKAAAAATALWKRREKIATMVRPFKIGESFIAAATTTTGSVDCSIVTRYCTADTDCSVMCKSYDAQQVVCDPTEHVCSVTAQSPPTIDDGGGGGGDDDNAEKRRCNEKLGEYAILVGYSSLGTAIWQCVPLYAHFTTDDGGHRRFCEGGIFRMNAMLREPSYRDCACPPGTVRMIKRVIDQYDIGLPHCIAAKDKLFYQDDLTVMEDSDDDDDRK